MYFKNLGKILYSFEGKNGNRENRIITNITKNVRFIRNSLAQITDFDDYQINDGETPEIISELFYDTPNYHWIIMIANEKFDYKNDFPLSEKELEAHIEKKHGKQRREVRHYVINNTIIMANDKALDEDEYKNETKKAVSFEEHERNVNDEKRKIKVPKIGTVQAIMNDFARVVR